MTKDRYIDLLVSGNNFEVLYEYHLETNNNRQLTKQQFLVKIQQLERLNEMLIFDFDSFMFMVHKHYGNRFSITSLFDRDKNLIGVY